MRQNSKGIRLQRGTFLLTDGMMNNKYLTEQRQSFLNPIGNDDVLRPGINAAR